MNWKSIEKILGIYTYSLAEEGTRLAKIKALTASLEVLKAVRKVAMLHLSALMASSVFAVSTLALIMHGIYQYTIKGFVVLDLFSLIALVASLGSLSFVIYLARDRYWMDAIGLEKQINALISTTETSNEARQDRSENSEKSGLSERDLALLKQMIEQTVERQFENEQQQREHAKLASDNFRMTAN